MTASPRVVALYLPQYHPIPENDAWWEPGFTEWTNVTRARPLYRGHAQPNLPAELGYYDLRIPEVRERQSRLAAEHGVSAFCYYHYWFGHGKRLLERPFSEVLASGKPDFPFMLCWANQTWSGIWHGLNGRSLIEQTYPGREDEARHFAELLPAFRDARCLRVNDKPVFMVYSPMGLPDPKAFTDHWRQLAHDAGLPGLYLMAEHGDSHWDAQAHGFDAFVLKPHFKLRRSRVPWSQPREKIANLILDLRGVPTRHDYRRAQDHLLPRDTAHNAIHCVIPNWDNTPRSGAQGMVLDNASPQAFGQALDRALTNTKPLEDGRGLLFIKSWNEWGEGNHLEPNRSHGRGYLEVLRERIIAPPTSNTG